MSKATKAAVQAEPATWEPVADKGASPVRVTGLTIALVLLAASCITMFYAALRIASIWFEPRFVPVAQLIVAGLGIAVCLLVIRRLKQA